MSPEIMIGIDIGGTSIVIGRVNNSNIEAIYSVPTGAERHADEILETLYGAIEQVLIPKTGSIGIGVPGLLNTETGELLEIVNIPSWKNLALKEKIEKRYNLPVWVNNDANCLALGELYFGKGQRYKNIVTISLGTGVGAGLIINGKLHSGVFGGAGEIGFWPYKNEIVETYCGSKFFTEKYGITGKELYLNALSNNNHALRLFEEYGCHLGELVKRILFFFAPEAIIFSGSISESFHFFERAMRKEISTFPFKVLSDYVFIGKSELRQPAVLGAASLYYNNNV